MEPISDSVPNMSLPLSTPIKKSSDSKNISTSSVSDQILTPEKSDQTPLTRSRTRTDFTSRSEDEKADDLVLRFLKSLRPKVKLNKKYDELANFFNSMVTSIRLLKLKRQPPTFPNISASIQNLTERRFTHKHLAQLKYIFPEAIIIEKVLLHDPVTSCMYPELHISLQVDAIGDYSKGKGDTDYSLLRRVLRDRIVDFSKSHPEGDDVPEEELPYPFSQTKPPITSLNKPPRPFKSMPATSTMPAIVSSTSQPEFSVSSHKPLGPFKSSFCRKAFIPEDQKTPLACYSNNVPSTENLSAPIASKRPLKSIPFIRLITPSTPSALSTIEENKTMATCSSDSKIEPMLLKGTPTKALLTPASPMSNTPESQTPKRKRDSLGCETTPQMSARRSTRTKLFMPPKKDGAEVDDHNAYNSSSGKHDILDFLPDSHLQSMKRRAKLIARLPRTFDMILKKFQTSSRYFLTKEELVHNIIANGVDRGEYNYFSNISSVEEQLKLLREIAPDWLSEKSSSEFGILYSIDKLWSAEDVRQRLASAK